MTEVAVVEPQALDAGSARVIALRPELRLEGVGVRFGAVTALEQVSLELRAGERVAFVGANGSGKSTLLRVLHGLQRPTSGRVERAAGLRQAMLFQRPAMLRLSVENNVALGLWLAGVPRAMRRERVTEALVRVGLVAEAKRPARALSGGQQQRLALARAWALKPQQLLLDEPTASLDPSAKREVEALIGQFARQGLTVLFSSHNLGQVKRLATRVVYLEHGRVLADRSVHEFFEADGDHLPPAAQQFLKGELPW
ncbi:phosphate ABC transporter ATP-binding protein [Caldimonas sp. KR1-144]|uniref:ABC transporter ATP-binding protein n=1 Tax=Caldimonas sp. KR1-144 TaxID=3400911 RepID=UPI003C021E2C